MFRKGVISVIISFLFVFLITPFSISANSSLPSPFLGVNINIIDQNTYQRINSIDTSIETISSTGIDSFQCTSWGNSGCAQYRFTDYTGAGSGTFANLTFSVTPQYSSVGVNGAIYTNAIYEYEFILDNYYVGYINITFNNVSDNYFVNGNSFTVTKTVSNATFTINNYELDLLDSNKTMWMYPIESFNIVSYALSQGFNQRGITTEYNYLYPIFTINTNDELYKGYFNAGNSYYFMFYSNRANINSSTVNNYFDFGDFSIISLRSFNNYIFDGYINTRLYRVELKNDNSNGRTISIKYIGTDTISYIPIYFNQTNFKALSTDFALQNYLTNDLLDNISIIANGTTQSNNSSNQLDNSNDEMNDNINNLITREDDFNDDFNEKVGNINTNNNNLNSFGSGFINSAQWVRNQFDTITENNIYGQVLGFSLLVGLSLLIIGRWFG